MVDREKTIIPLHVAYDVLAAFGVDPSSKTYQRWRRDDGFRLVDLEQMLRESRLLLRADWRDWLQDIMGVIQDQLRTIGIIAQADLGSVGEQGNFQIDGRKRWIKYVPDDDDDFDRVVRSINSLIRAWGSYRKLRSCEGTDGWVYGLLSNRDWNKLDSTASDLVNLLFTSDLR
jgi:hypothetical protein